MPRSSYQRQVEGGAWVHWNPRDFDDASTSMIKLAKAGRRALLFASTDPADEAGIRRLRHFRASPDGTIAAVDMATEQAAAETARRAARQELAVGLLRRANAAAFPTA